VAEKRSNAVFEAQQADAFVTVLIRSESDELGTNESVIDELTARFVRLKGCRVLSRRGRRPARAPDVRRRVRQTSRRAPATRVEQTRLGHWTARSRPKSAMRKKTARRRIPDERRWRTPSP